MRPWIYIIRQPKRKIASLKLYAISGKNQKAFPRTPFCIVGDALYACERVVCLCEENEWRYVLTLKEGQPTLWGETLELFGLAPQNHATVLHAPDGEKPEYRDFRWVEDLKFRR